MNAVTVRTNYELFGIQFLETELTFGDHYLLLR